ncbi:CPBP family intramembrane metalloprotease [Acidiferrimicrobium sp. IK]|uniref:CPBP family intramembrane glutamic endopeptidase n=1 Tax=Acidiferrimicrobium sp. IK TaxID=2871700 RepID=UPI0021CB976C|nr:CPBP family intramembrane glutamic endopeptidase [Acidiferrimicrobium sp. IK]MCU4187421.1 CPBP family intramembrane metalloprotease [Acidiferrimicrobium sp. IK]
MTLKLVVGVVVAFGAWAVMFAVQRRGFWTRAACAAATIAVYAVAVDPGAIGHQFARHHWYADLLVGAGAGVGLYAVFWVGEQVLVLILPALAAEVGDLYSLKGQAHPALMPVVLAVAASGEELFFRGFLWHRAGVVAALLVYGAVHIPARKVILVVAALLGGAAWGALFSWTGGLVAPVASHLLWIFMIVIWKPARPTAWSLRMAGRLRGRPDPAEEA